MNSTVEGLHKNVLYIPWMAALSYSLAMSLPANASILWLILREAQLAPDIFYFNLSWEEILFTVCMIWSFFGFQYNCTRCIEATTFIQSLFFTARPLFQCLICLECYLGVNHPVVFLRLKPLRYRLACCAASWLLTTISGIYHLYTYKNIQNLFTFFTQHLLLFFTVIFCLVSVLWTLKRPGPGANNGQKKSNRAKTRAFKILSVTMVSMMVNFLLCIGPIPLQLWLPKWKFLFVYTICTSLSVVTGSTQPLIYLQRSKKRLCLQLH